MKATEFWDDLFLKGQESSYSKVEMPDLKDPILTEALNYWGDVKDKTIIDLGCGRGATTLFFAYSGANVISIDLSENAIHNLSDYCKTNHISNITLYIFYFYAIIFPNHLKCWISTFLDFQLFGNGVTDNIFS